MNVHYIDGQWASAPSRTFEDRNPYNDEVVAEVAAGGPAEATQAVQAAAAAFPAWAASGPGERQRLFLAAAAETERRTDDIVRILALETGAGAAIRALSDPVVVQPPAPGGGMGLPALR